MAVGSFSAGLSGLNANQQKLERHRQQPREHQHGRLQGELVHFCRPRQPVRRRSERQSDADRSRRRHRRRSRRSSRQGSIENTGVATNVAIQGSGLLRGRRPARTAPTRAPAISASTPTACSSPPMASRCRASRRSIRRRAPSITTGHAGDIIIPPGVLRAPVATHVVRHDRRISTPARRVGATFTSSVQIYDSLGTTARRHDDVHEDRPPARGTTRSRCRVRT